VVREDHTTVLKHKLMDKMGIVPHLEMPVAVVAEAAIVLLPGCLVTEVMAVCTEAVAVDRLHLIGKLQMGVKAGTGSLC
jgi:hypothetical protein